MCYDAEFDLSASKSVGISKEYPENGDIHGNLVKCRAYVCIFLHIIYFAVIGQSYVSMSYYRQSFGITCWRI